MELNWQHCEMFRLCSDVFGIIWSLSHSFKHWCNSDLLLLGHVRAAVVWGQFLYSFITAPGRWEVVGTMNRQASSLAAKDQNGQQWQGKAVVHLQYCSAGLFSEFALSGLQFCILITLSMSLRLNVIIDLYLQQLAMDKTRPAMTGCSWSHVTS